MPLLIDGKNAMTSYLMEAVDAIRFVWIALTVHLISGVTIFDGDYKDCASVIPIAMEHSIG